MKTLVIPDIHNKHVKAQKIIDEYGDDADNVVFLGDYFDDFHDCPREVETTAEWLANNMENHPHWTYLVGNHDLAYLKDPFWSTCSGNTKDKWRKIYPLLRKHLGMFELAHYSSDKRIIFSHAGLTKKFLDKMRGSFKNTNVVDCLNLKLYKELGILSDKNAVKDGPDPFAVGESRGGISKVPGCLWCDYDIDYIHDGSVMQIFGHTPHDVPKIYALKTDEYWKAIHIWKMSLRPDEMEEVSPFIAIDLDTHLNHFMIIEDDDVKIMEVVDYLDSPYNRTMI